MPDVVRGMQKFVDKEPRIVAMKPEGMKDYLTRRQLADLLGRDIKRLSQLEKENRIPSPIRVKQGKQTFRLYSPKEVEQIVEFFKGIKYTKRRR